MTVTDASAAEPRPAPRRLGQNVSSLAAGQMVTWTTSLAAAVIIPRILGPAALGTLVTATSVASIFGLLLGFVTVNYLVRELVARPTEGPALLGSALFIRLAMVPVFLGAVAIYAHFADYGGDQLLILGLMTLATAVNLLMEPLQAVFQAHEQMHFIALSSVITQSSLGLVGIALVLVGVRAVGIAVSTLVIAVLTVPIYTAWARRHTSIDRRVTMPKVRALARGSLPYMTIGVAMLVYTWIDAVLLSLLAPSQVVGWYGVCVRLFAAMLFVPTIICTAWFPRLVSAFEVDPKRLWDHARPNVELVFVLGIAVSVAAAIGAAPIIHLMYGPAYDSAVPVMVILACCLPLMYLGIVFGQVLIAAGRPTVLTTFLIVGGVVNAALNIALIPVFQHHYGNGAIGSALSFLATEILITTAGFMVVGRHVLTRSSWARAARTAVAAAAMFAVGFLLRGFGVFALIPAGLTFVGLAFLLKIPTQQEQAILMSALQRTTRRLRRRSVERDATSEPDDLDVT